MSSFTHKHTSNVNIPVYTVVPSKYTHSSVTMVTYTCVRGHSYVRVAVSQGENNRASERDGHQRMKRETMAK